MGVPHPRRRRGPGDALRWVCVYFSKVMMAKWPCAVQGASLMPPCTLLRLNLLFHIDSITLAPLTLLVARSYFFNRAFIGGFTGLIVVCQLSGGGFCCSFGGGCGVTLRVGMAFQPFQIWCGFLQGFAHKGESCIVVRLRGLCSSAGGHYPILCWCWGCGACQCC